MKTPKKTKKSRIKKAVSKPRKRKPVKPPVAVKKPVRNAHHPDIGHMVEEAFKAGGVQYYRFKKEYQMPTGRYKWVLNYLKEVDLRIDLKTAKGYLEVIETQLNGKKGSINLGEIWKVVHAFKSRLDLEFEVETVKRLASVTYFDDTEDLTGYDMAHAKNKMQVWPDSGTLDFFLTSPISDVLNLNNISPESLQEYLNDMKTMIYVPTFETPPSSEQNSSENSMNP